MCVKSNETAVLLRGPQGSAGWQMLRFADAALAERVAGARCKLQPAQGLVLTEPLVVNVAAAPANAAHASANLDGLDGADLLDAVIQKPDDAPTTAPSATVTAMIAGRTVTYTGSVQASYDGNGAYTVTLLLTSSNAPRSLKNIEGSFTTDGPTDGSGVTLTEIPLWKGASGLQLENPATAMDYSTAE